MTQPPASPALTEDDQAMREEIARTMCVAYKLQPDLKHYGKAPDGSFCGISEAGPEVPVDLRPIPMHWHHGWRRFLHIADAVLAGPLATLRARATAAEATLREREAEIERLKLDRRRVDNRIRAQRATLRQFEARHSAIIGSPAFSSLWSFAKKKAADCRVLRAALAQPDLLPETATGGEDA
jgi:hypothetical protein